MAVKKAISKRKTELMEERVINCEGDQKKLFSLKHSLFGSKKITVLPEYTSFFYFGIFNQHVFKMEFPLLEACLLASCWCPLKNSVCFSQPRFSKGHLVL